MTAEVEGWEGWGEKRAGLETGVWPTVFAPCLELVRSPSDTGDDETDVYSEVGISLRFEGEVDD
jgi:hypothetical protein